TRKQWLKSETFDGTTALSTFLSKFETCARYNNWSSRDKLAHLRVNLRGSAAQVVTVEDSKDLTYGELVKQLKERYGTEGQMSLYKTQLRTRRRGKTETLQHLYFDVENLALLAYPGPQTDHSRSIAIDAFIESLDDDDLAYRVR